MTSAERARRGGRDDALRATRGTRWSRRRCCHSHDRSPPALAFEPATPIDEVELASVRAMPTGISELDRVLGGGFVPGSVTLIGGEPGVGKSTLLTQVAAGDGVRRPRRAVRVGRRVAAAGASARPGVSAHSRPSCGWHPRPSSRTCSRRPTVCSRAWSSSTRSRPCTIRPSVRRPGRRCRCASARTGSCARRSSAISPSCSSATSRRTAASPVHACSSTSSTPCCASTAIAITRCGCCGRRSTGSGRPPSSGCSR